MGNAALRLLVRLGAWFAALPYIGVVVLVLTGSPTWSAIGYLLGMGLLIAGLMTLPVDGAKARRAFGRTWPRGISRGAVGALVAVALIRGCSGGRGNTLHFAPDARFVDRIVEESDLAVPGTRFLVASGFLHDDAKELPAAMRAAYAKMRAQEGDVPSPVLATYLGLQSPDAYDLVLLANRAACRRYSSTASTTRSRATGSRSRTRSSTPIRSSSRSTPATSRCSCEARRPTPSSARSSRP